MSRYLFVISTWDVFHAVMVSHNSAFTIAVLVWLFIAVLHGLIATAWLSCLFWLIPVPHTLSWLSEFLFCRPRLCMLCSIIFTIVIIVIIIISRQYYCDNKNNYYFDGYL